MNVIVTSAESPPHKILSRLVSDGFLAHSAMESLQFMLNSTENVINELFVALDGFIESIETENEILREEANIAEESLRVLEDQFKAETEVFGEKGKISDALVARVASLEQELESNKLEQAKALERIREQMVEESEKMDDQVAMTNWRRQQAEDEAELSQQEAAQFQKQLMNMQRQYLESVEENCRLVQELSNLELQLQQQSPPTLEEFSETETEDLEPKTPPADYRHSTKSDATLFDCDCKTKKKPSKTLFCDVDWLRTSNLQLCRLIELTNAEINRTLQQLSVMRAKCSALTKENEALQKKPKRRSIMGLIYGKKG